MRRLHPNRTARRHCRHWRPRRFAPARVVVGQDDYDAWVGESALVRWGSGSYADQGWIRYDRHQGRANYIYTDGHVDNLAWRDARKDHYPDHRVRNPLAGPPN